MRRKQSRRLRVIASKIGNKMYQYRRLKKIYIKGKWPAVLEFINELAQKTNERFT